MESNGTCVLLRVCECCKFTTKKILAKRAGNLVQEKKIVHDPYVFAGPLRSALPPPPRSFLLFGHRVNPVCHVVIVGTLHRAIVHVALHHCVRMVCAGMLHCTIVSA